MSKSVSWQLESPNWITGQEDHGKNCCKERSKFAAILTGSELIITGGRLKSGPSARDAWEYDFGLQWKLLENDDCSQRLPLLEGHAMCTTDWGDTYIFGGSFSRSRTCFWTFACSSGRYSFRPVKTETADEFLPENRKGHTLTFCSDVLIMFGGYIDIHGPSSAAWRFNCDSKRWSLDRPIYEPKGRHCHTTVAFNGCLYVFGGLTEFRPNDDLLEYNVDHMTWQMIPHQSSTPEARYGHCACISASKMFIYGGANSKDEQLGDLWCYNIASGIWEQLSLDWPPSRRLAPPPCIYGSLIAFPSAGKIQKKKSPTQVTELNDSKKFPDTRPQSNGSNNKRSRLPSGSTSVCSDSDDAAVLINSLRSEERSVSTDTQPYMINAAFISREASKESTLTEIELLDRTPRTSPNSTFSHRFGSACPTVSDTTPVALARKVVTEPSLNIVQSAETIEMTNFTACEDDDLDRTPRVNSPVHTMQKK